MKLLAVMTFVAAWEAKQSMPVALSDMTSTAIGAYTVLVVGGCDDHQLSCSDWDGCTYCPSVSNRTLEYSVADDRWRELASAPRERFRHAAAYDGEDKVYVVGGRDVVDDLVGEVDVYSISTNSWTTLDYGVEASDLGAVFYEGMLYVYGGYDASYTAMATGLALDAQGSKHAVPDMAHPRGDFALIKQGTEAYAVGGWSHENWCQPLATVEKLDLVTMVWESQPELLVARGDKASAYVDALYVVGGEHNNNCTTASWPVDDVERLGQDSWTAVASVPEPKFRFAAVGLDSALFVFGGQAAQSTSCPEADFCYPVTDHCWMLDLSGNNDDDDDDDGSELSTLEATLVVLLIVLVLGYLVIIAKCMFFTASSEDDVVKRDATDETKQVEQANEVELAKTTSV